jgi:hypothetical protein
LALFAHVPLVWYSETSSLTWLTVIAMRATCIACRISLRPSKLTFTQRSSVSVQKRRVIRRVVFYFSTLVFACKPFTWLEKLEFVGLHNRVWARFWSCFWIGKGSWISSMIILKVGACKDKKIAFWDASIFWCLWVTSPCSEEC